MKTQRVLNLSKGCVLLARAQVADKLFQRLKGLLGRRELPSGSGMIIKPCQSVHTVGMSFPIDVAFVDREDTVCCLIREMPPFRFSTFDRKASYVIEAPAGTFRETGTEVGDRLKLEEI